MISLTFIILILLLIINTIIAYCPEEPDIDGHLEITTTIINNGGYENCDCSQDIKSVTFASDVTTVPVDMFKSCKTLERVLIRFVFHLLSLEAKISYWCFCEKTPRFQIFDVYKF